MRTHTHTTLLQAVFLRLASSLAVKMRGKQQLSHTNAFIIVHTHSSSDKVHVQCHSFLGLKGKIHINKKKWYGTYCIASKSTHTLGVRPFLQTPSQHIPDILSLPGKEARTGRGRQALTLGSSG